MGDVVGLEPVDADGGKKKRQRAEHHRGPRRTVGEKLMSAGGIATGRSSSDENPGGPVYPFAGGRWTM